MHCHQCSLYLQRFPPVRLLIQTTNALFSGTWICLSSFCSFLTFCGDCCRWMPKCIVNSISKGSYSLSKKSQQPQKHPLEIMWAHSMLIPPIDTKVKCNWNKTKEKFTTTVVFQENKFPFSTSYYHSSPPTLLLLPGPVFPVLPATACIITSQTKRHRVSSETRKNTSYQVNKRPAFELKPQHVADRLL